MNQSSRLPCYVFFLCMLTNKNPNEVELGDQLLCSGIFPAPRIVKMWKSENICFQQRAEMLWAFINEENKNGRPSSSVFNRLCHSYDFHPSQRRSMNLFWSISVEVPPQYKCRKLDILLISANSVEVCSGLTCLGSQGRRRHSSFLAGHSRPPPHSPETINPTLFCKSVPGHGKQAILF